MSSELRCVVLMAAVKIDRLIRANLTGRRSGPLLVGAGVLTAVVAVALAQLTGVDVRGGFGAGQSGLVPTLLLAVYRDEP